MRTELDLHSVLDDLAASAPSGAEVLARMNVADRRPRARRRLPTLAAAAAVVLASIIAIAAPWRHPTAAYAVETRSDGAVQLTISMKDFADPPALQHELDEAGARTTLLTREQSAGAPSGHYFYSWLGASPSDPACAQFAAAIPNTADLFSGTEIPVKLHNAHAWASEQENWDHATFTIDPSRIVSGGTIVIGIITHDGDVVALGLQEVVGAVPSCLPEH